MRLPFATSSEMAARFVRDRRGTTAVLLGLALIPMSLAAAAAIDYTRAAATREKMQALVDQSILAALQERGSEQVNAAERMAAGGLLALGLTPDAVAFAPTANGGLRGRLRTTVAPVFNGVLNGGQAIELSVSAEGIVRQTPADPAAGPSRACLVLTDPSAGESLRVNGGAALRAPGCEIHVHSTANVGAVFNGGATVDARRICLKGPNYLANGQTRLGPIERNCKVADDPFAGHLPAPVTGPCLPNPAAVERPKTRSETVLQPGTYCGEVTFSGQQTIRFEPGLYVLKGGRMTVNGGSTLKGEGVTFYFADAGAGLQVNGNATLDLVAPTRDAYKDVLMFEPAGLSRSSVTLSGGAGHRLSGLIYLPSRSVTFNGASTLHGDNATMVFNALTLNGGGGSEWRVEAAASRAIPVAGGLTSTSAAEIVLRY